MKNKLHTPVTMSIKRNIAHIEILPLQISKCARCVNRQINKN